MTSRPFAPASAVLDAWRHDTPGCRDRIHLNNAGAALMPRPVLDTLARHVQREGEIGGYEAAEEAAAAVRETYELVARLVGAAARNIAGAGPAYTAPRRQLGADQLGAGAGRRRGGRGVRRARGAVPRGRLPGRRADGGGRARAAL